MTSPSNSDVQNLLPVQAYFNLDGSFNTFIGQGNPFYATANPVQSGLTITNSTLNSSPIGNTSPSTGVFTNIATTTGTVSTQPIGATDIVNLLALQAYAAGISWKQPCAVGTLVNITLSGLQTIDGYTTLAGDRVLVKNQSTAANNGIYLASATAWTRSLDANSWDELVSAISFLEYGTQAGGAWFCTATPGGTLGVTAVNWSQFTTSATYSAGTGLTLTGTQFSITPVGTASTYGSATQTPVFTTNASGQITTVTNTTITPAVGSITGLGTGVATALAAGVTGSGNIVLATSPTLITPALGTPASGVVTNLTGTASININGSVGATTPTTGAFTILSTSSTTNTTPVLGFNASNCNLASGATISGSYLQTVLQNKSGTAGASTNLAVSNDLATDSSYYGEFGMNSSVYSASTPADFFSINNGIYFSGHDGDISIGSGNGFKTYLAWGTSGQSAHVINATGAIGLSTNLGTTPSTSGTSGFGTSGQVLTSAGSGAAPTWTTPTVAAYPGAGIANSTGSAWGTSYSTTGSGTVVALATRPTMSVTGAGLTLQDATDNTKTANFDLSGLTTGTNYTYALPATSGSTIAVLGAVQTFTAAQTIGSGIAFNALGTANISGSAGSATSLGTSATTGTLTAGGTAQTGILTLGRSTVSQTTNIQAGATASASTKTINLGTGGLTGSTTAIAIGSTFGTTITLNGTVNGTISTATNATNIAITDDTTTATTCYPTWVTTTTGNLPAKTASTKLSFVPSTGTLSATKYLGDGSSLTGIVSGATIANDTSTASNLYPLFSSATSGTPTTIYTSNAKYLYKPSTGDLSASQVIASNGLILNNATVSASYTIATGNNAMSVGPVTVASGQSVTVSSGQRWVVL